MPIDTSYIYQPGMTTTGQTQTTTSSTKGKSDLDMNDFLMLMVEQMKNQDIGSTMDTSEYINQLSQYTMIQAVTEMAQSVSNGFSNLQEMTLSTYSMSMIGKEATVAVENSEGTIETRTGKVDGVTFYNGSPQVIIEGEQYDLSSVMSLADSGSGASTAIAQAANAAASAANAATQAATSTTEMAAAVMEAVNEVLSNDEEAEEETETVRMQQQTQNIAGQTGLTDAEILAGESAAAQRIAESE